MPHFSIFPCQILSFGYSSMNYEFMRREYGFLINLKILFVKLGNKPIVTSKLSAQIFADFDINVILLGQNIFE